MFLLFMNEVGFLEIQSVFGNTGFDQTDHIAVGAGQDFHRVGKLPEQESASLLSLPPKTSALPITTCSVPIRHLIFTR